MNIKRKLKRPVTLTAAGLIALTLLLTASSCSGDYEERQAEENRKIIEGESLEEKNLWEKVRREENPAAIRYMYLWVPNVAQPIGYFTIEGKISSSGSQLGPSDKIVPGCSGCERVVVDGPQDDNTYGEGDPGQFFFLTNGTMVTINGFITLDSDVPLELDVPEMQSEEELAKALAEELKKLPKLPNQP